MRRINSKADPLAVLPDVHPARIPRHVAVIMDGNGRWAQVRGLPRLWGHRNGAAAVRTLLEEAGRLGIEVLTLYSFSIENWKRPPDEVAALMQLAIAYVEGEGERLRKEGIRFRFVGRREGLPAPVLRSIDWITQHTARPEGPTLCIAMNYGGRAELVEAARALARRVASGELTPERIDEAAFESSLYTAGLPDPDLLIRTAGERRISNFLLWQVSYAEIHVTDALWPDFGREHLHAAVRDYASRSRRFGGLDAPG
ncbi:MAG: di-trans,poly-cis-decaprenylcistransferase [Phycisphaerae bacterium]|nr:di-trans,poly-cis-decaprenylcistransferase [Phycisphaerae bacterium]